MGADLLWLAAWVAIVLLALCRILLILVVVDAAAEAFKQSYYGPRIEIEDCRTRAAALEARLTRADGQIYNRVFRPMRAVRGVAILAGFLLDGTLTSLLLWVLP